VDPKVDIVVIEDDDTFASHHLADILNSASSSKRDLKDKLLAMQSKHEVFKGVKRSKKEKDATGASKDVSFTNMQICEKISKCRPDAVKTAAELLSWLKVSAIKCDAAGVDVVLCVEYELEFQKSCFDVRCACTCKQQTLIPYYFFEWECRRTGF